MMIRQLTEKPSSVGHGSAEKLLRCASIRNTTSCPQPLSLIAMLLQQLHGSNDVTQPG
jgi:hypothetical protein